MKYIFTLLTCLNFIYLGYSQNTNLPCSLEAILQRSLAINPDAKTDWDQTEIELQKIIADQKKSPEKFQNSTFTIPVVMHIFHNGDDGKMDMDQALAGLEILNNDFNGINDGWYTLSEQFDTIKSTLDINFCLATIDPDGNPTTGINYYEDEAAMNNEGDLFQHAWDNYKYLNIYFPKYTQGMPSDFTAYAFYPSTNGSDTNMGGIFYSSIRWGYGNHSELDEGDDWASVCTHEAGHWLNLLHTFSGGCDAPGDYVEDTPPTLLENGIELAGCDNNDFTCSVTTNGANFMDYNHRCKIMFTEGQVERMTAALYLPSRISLWSEENLMETGCLDLNTSTPTITSQKEISAYPNPGSDFIQFKGNDSYSNLSIYNSKGQLVNSYAQIRSEDQIDIRKLTEGLYFFSITTTGKIAKGRFVISR